MRSQHVGWCRDFAALETGPRRLDFNGCVYSILRRTSFNCATDLPCGWQKPSVKVVCFPMSSQFTVLALTHSSLLSPWCADKRVQSNKFSVTRFSGNRRSSKSSNDALPDDAAIVGLPAMVVKMLSNWRLIILGNRHSSFSLGRKRQPCPTC